MSVISLCEELNFSKIFTSYSKTLFNYLYYKCGNEEQAKDLTQEAFLKLWQNCSKVAYDKAEGYVFKTANNKLLNIYEHEKVKLKFQKLPQQTQTNQDPEFILEEKEFKSRIELAISDLPEKQRVVFLMSRVDKKTYKEIAEILGISKQAVEKRIYIALDKLRKVHKKIN